MPPARAPDRRHASIRPVARGHGSKPDERTTTMRWSSKRSGSGSRVGREFHLDWPPEAACHDAAKLLAAVRWQRDDDLVHAICCTSRSRLAIGPPATGHALRWHPGQSRCPRNEHLALTHASSRASSWPIGFAPTISTLRAAPRTRGRRRTARRPANASPPAPAPRTPSPAANHSRENRRSPRKNDIATVSTSAVETVDTTI